MDRKTKALNALIFIGMVPNEFYPFSTIYPGSGYLTVEKCNLPHGFPFTAS